MPNLDARGKLYNQGKLYTYLYKYYMNIHFENFPKIQKTVTVCVGSLQKYLQLKAGLQEKKNEKNLTMCSARFKKWKSRNGKYALFVTFCLGANRVCVCPFWATSLPGLSQEVSSLGEKLPPTLQCSWLILLLL